MELEQERKKKILEEEKIRVLEEQKSRETENIKLEQEKNEKESNSELKRICRELLSIISNDKFRSGYEYMLTPQESRQIAFANLNIAKNNIHKLENIKCNLQCIFLTHIKENLICFIIQELTCLKYFLIVPIILTIIFLEVMILKYISKKQMNTMIMNIKSKKILRV